MMTSVSSNGSYWFVDAKAGEHHAKVCGIGLGWTGCA
jgi:hypothetical protein